MIVCHLQYPSFKLEVYFHLASESFSRNYSIVLGKKNLNTPPPNYSECENYSLIWVCVFDLSLCAEVGNIIKKKNPDS